MQEKILKAKPGMPMLILFIILYLAMVGLVVLGACCWTAAAISGHCRLLSGSSDSLWGSFPFSALKSLNPRKLWSLPYLATTSAP